MSPICIIFSPMLLWNSSISLNTLFSSVASNSTEVNTLIASLTSIPVNLDNACAWACICAVYCPAVNWPSLQAEFIPSTAFAILLNWGICFL